MQASQCSVTVEGGAGSLPRGGEEFYHTVFRPDTSVLLWLIRSQSISGL